MSREICDIISSPPISFKNIVRIAELPNGQRTNSAWLDLHHSVITASRFQQVINIINGVSRSRIDGILAKSNFVNEAMLYGQQKEERARQDYIARTGYRVMETGLYLFPSGLLGASPDGLIYTEPNDTSPSGVLEIKCPYSMRNATSSEFKLFAEKNHMKHYAQIQGQIAATRLKFADLVYWSPQGYWQKRIPADVKWEKKYVQKMEDLAHESSMQSNLISIEILTSFTFEL